MKKLIILTICGLFLAATCVQAIDKTVKVEDRKDIEKTDTTQVDADKTKIDNDNPDKDNFIDKNNNGIDDRAETTKKVAPENPDDMKKQAEKHDDKKPSTAKSFK